LFTTPEDVARGVAAFERHPRAAVVNFTILGPDGVLSRRDWCHPRDPDRWANTEFVTDYVLEGASACRREAFVASGGYWAPFFIGHEGWDLALRLLDAGHELVYTPDVRVRHMVDPTVRPSSRIYYTFTRNAGGGARRRALRVDARRDRRRARQRAGAGYPARDVAGDRATAGADPRAEALDPRARPASCTRATDLVVRSDTRDAAHRGDVVTAASGDDAGPMPR